VLMYGQKLNIRYNTKTSIVGKGGDL
jgi:hypothetical protein